VFEERRVTSSMTSYRKEAAPRWPQEITFQFPHSVSGGRFESVKKNGRKMLFGGE